MDFAFHHLCPRYSGTLTPTAPTAIRLWKPLPLPFIVDRSNLLTIWEDILKYFIVDISNLLTIGGSL